MTRTWRRNLWATWWAELLAIMAFSATAPVWAFYLQELGVTGDNVARWNGIIAAAPALTMTVLGPIWGALSDRYGRKMMVMRAMFGGAVTVGLMGFVRAPEQLTVLRLLQGAFTGTVAAATTLVASGTPREHLGETLGKLQLAIFLGQSLGPVTGGILADYLGYRATFWLSAGYLFMAGVLILTLVREKFTPAVEAVQTPVLTRLWRDTVVIFTGSLLGLVLSLRFISRLGLGIATPVVPLVVQEILPSGVLLASATGLLTTVSGIFSAVAAPILGRWGDRHGGRALLLGSSLLMAGALVLQGIASAYWLMVVAQALLGLAVGGTLAIISAYIGRMAPEGRAGTAYGLDSMAVSLSNTIGPAIGGWLGGDYNLRLPFHVGGVVMALGSLAVLWLPRSESPVQASK
ncbi:MAG: MFS transporter [Anaerolineae bacterium]|nr:MFS transporter [Anaerolineae bacterium]